MTFIFPKIMFNPIRRLGVPGTDSVGADFSQVFRRLTLKKSLCDVLIFDNDR